MFVLCIYICSVKSVCMYCSVCVRGESWTAGFEDSRPGGRGMMGLWYRMGTVLCDSQVIRPIDCAKLVALYMCAHHTVVATGCTATLAVCVAL